MLSEGVSTPTTDQRPADLTVLDVIPSYNRAGSGAAKATARRLKPDVPFARLPGGIIEQIESGPLGKVDLGPWPDHEVVNLLE